MNRHEAPLGLVELVELLQLRLVSASRSEREAAAPRLAAAYTQTMVGLMSRPGVDRLVTVAEAAEAAKMPTRKIFSLARARKAKWALWAGPRSLRVDLEMFLAAVRNGDLTQGEIVTHKREGAPTP